MQNTNWGKLSSFSQFFCRHLPPEKVEEKRQHRTDDKARHNREVERKILLSDTDVPGQKTSTRSGKPDHRTDDGDREAGKNEEFSNLHASKLCNSG